MDKLVFGVIVAKSNLANRVCTMSLENIASRLGVCRRTVQISVSKLRESGLIVQESQNNGATNRLRPNLDKLREIAAAFTNETAEGSETPTENPGEEAKNDDKHRHANTSARVEPDCQGGSKVVPGGVEPAYHQEEEIKEDSKENPPYPPLGKGVVIFPFDDAPGEAVNFQFIDEEARQHIPATGRKRDAYKWLTGTRFGQFIKDAFPEIIINEEAAVMFKNAYAGKKVNCEFLAKAVMEEPCLRKYSNVPKLLDKILNADIHRPLCDWQHSLNDLIDKFERHKASVDPGMLQDIQKHGTRVTTESPDESVTELVYTIAGNIFTRQTFPLADEVIKNGKFTVMQNASTQLLITMLYIKAQNAATVVSIRDNVHRDIISFIATDGKWRSFVLSMGDKLSRFYFGVKSDEINAASESYESDLVERLRRYGVSPDQIATITEDAS